MKKYDIKELMKNTDFEAQRNDKELQDFQNKEIVEREYFNFDIEKMEKAMSEESETMPVINNLKELEDWLNRDYKNEL